MYTPLNPRFSYAIEGGTITRHFLSCDPLYSVRSGRFFLCDLENRNSSFFALSSKNAVGLPSFSNN